MIEIWKDIEGYEGLYQVSSIGRIKGLNRLGADGRKLKGEVLKIMTNSVGYHTVSLCKDNTVRHFTIHRLVAKAFIENRLGKEQVNHIDGVKTNNNIENLEWSSPSENTQHSCDTGLRKGLTLKKVKITNLLTDEIIHFSSMRKAGAFFGYGTSWMANRKLRNGNPFKYNHYLVEIF